MYTPIFGTECQACGHSPVVGLELEEGVESSGFCGVCFFDDRTMIDWTLWNNPQEDTE